MEGRRHVGGLEPPVPPRKPASTSIPLGVLCVFPGWLLYRDKRAQDMREELYVRQNTGIHAETASPH